LTENLDEPIEGLVYSLYFWEIKGTWYLIEDLDLSELRK